MASNEGVTLGLTYWVDSKKKRVAMAEARGDFVDVLFSFLSLPLGTITRLQSEGKFLHNQPFEIGCINNLYRSVKHLNPDEFWNKICKDMLISPRNPLEAFCQKLKVKLDDTLPTKYFMCHSCSRSKDLLVSTFDGARCHCGKLMKKETELLVEEPKEEENGVFVKGDAMFFIFDDLRVIRSSPGDSVQPLLKHRFKDLSKTDPVVADLGVNEIFNILKQALTSKSPLSDVFIESKESKPSYTFSPYTGSSHLKDYLEIKVIVSKSQNKVLFVEANADFVDFLVSFLTTPLGSILDLMNAKLSLGSIDNLYTSVKNLNPSWFIESSHKSLLNLRVAPQFGCKSNNLNASQDTPKYWYGTGAVKDNMGRIMISKRKDMVQDPKEVKLFEPRCCDGAREPAVGFMKRPCLFVVMDDLQVKSITTTSSILYLQKQENIQLNDLEEHLVEIRKSHEALNLLGASLTCKEGALTRSLFYLLRKWKYQRWIPFWGVLGRKKKRHGNQKEVEEKEKESAVVSDMEEKEKESAVESDMRNREKDMKEVKKKGNGKKKEREREHVNNS